MLRKMTSKSRGEVLLGRMLPRLLDVVAQSVWDIDSQDEYDDFESVTDKYQVTSSYMHKVW